MDAKKWIEYGATALAAYLVVTFLVRLVESGAGQVQDALTQDTRDYSGAYYAPVFYNPGFPYGGYGYPVGSPVDWGRARPGPVAPGPRRPGLGGY